ncbi:MAG: DRTGG domain-containing protein [Candidatus Thorarchaeota archaeon]
MITSGDRSDICLTALETDTNLLILTGGMDPDIRTIARARELDVPIMITAHDTYTTNQLVDNLIGTVTGDNREKLAIVEKMVGDSLDLTTWVCKSLKGGEHANSPIIKEMGTQTPGGALYTQRTIN